MSVEETPDAVRAEQESEAESVAPWCGPLRRREAPFDERLLGSWRFGRAVAGSDTESRRRCAANRAPGAPDRWIDRIVTGGPLVNDDSFTFQNGVDALTTQIVEPAEFTLYLVCRTFATGLGVGRADRAAFAGWFGGGAGKGAVAMAYSATAMRALAFENPAAPAAITNELAVAGDLDRWRIIAFRANRREFQLVDLSEGVEAEPTQTPRGRAVGANKFRIGGVHATYRGKTVEIHSAALYAADHSADQRDAVREAARASFEGTSIDA